MSQKSPKSFATFRENAAGIKFHENLRIKISLEFKVANCWKGRKICLKLQFKKLYKNLVIYYRKSKKKGKQMSEMESPE